MFQRAEEIEFVNGIGSDPQYMAPERYRLEAPSNAAGVCVCVDISCTSLTLSLLSPDVWALGCVLYEICCGVVPFMNDKPWSHIVMNVPRAVSPLMLPVFKACFQPDPSKRASSLQVLMYLRSAQDKCKKSKLSHVEVCGACISVTIPPCSLRLHSIPGSV